MVKIIMCFCAIVMMTTDDTISITQSSSKLIFVVYNRISWNHK